MEKWIVCYSNNDIQTDTDNPEPKTNNMNKTITQMRAENYTRYMAYMNSQYEGLTTRYNDLSKEESSLIQKQVALLRDLCAHRNT